MTALPSVLPPVLSPVQTLVPPESPFSHLVEKMVDKKVMTVAMGILTIVAFSATAALLTIAFPVLTLALPLGVGIAGGSAILAHYYIICYLHSNSKTETETALRVDFLVKHMLIQLLVVGGIALGSAAGCLLIGCMGIIAFASTGSLLTLLGSLINITFTLGFSFPLGQFILSTSNSFYHSTSSDSASSTQATPFSLDEFSKIIVHALSLAQGQFFLSLRLVGELLNDHSEGNTVLNELISDTFSFLTSEGDLVNLLETPNLPERVFTEIPSKFRNILTLSFLIERYNQAHLDERFGLNFERLIRNLLEETKNSEAYTSFQTYQTELERMVERLNADGQSHRYGTEQDALTLEKVETFNARLSVITFQFDIVFERMRQVWEVVDSELDLSLLQENLQQAIQEIFSLRQAFNAFSGIVHPQTQEGSLGQRLSDLSGRLANDRSMVQEDRSYLFSTVCLTEDDARNILLALDIAIPRDKDPTTLLKGFLRDYSLFSEKKLREERIIESGQATQDKDTCIHNLIDYLCTQLDEGRTYLFTNVGLREYDVKKILSSLKIAIPPGRAPIALLNALQREHSILSEDQLIEAKILEPMRGSRNKETCIQNLIKYLSKVLRSSSSTWETVVVIIQPIVSFIFNQIIPAAFFALILFVSPVSTMIGLSAGLLMHWWSGNITQGSPSDSITNLSVGEISRSFFVDAFLTQCMIFLGPIGGLISGIYLANALKNRTIQFYHYADSIL